VLQFPVCSSSSIIYVPIHAYQFKFQGLTKNNTGTTQTYLKKEQYPGQHYPGEPIYIEVFIMASNMEGVYNTILDDKKATTQYTLPNATSCCLNVCMLLIPPNFPAL
jgi:hypothetical protein